MKGCTSEASERSRRPTLSGLVGYKGNRADLSVLTFDSAARRLRRKDATSWTRGYNAYCRVGGGAVVAWQAKHRRRLAGGLGEPGGCTGSCRLATSWLGAGSVVVRVCEHSIFQLEANLTLLLHRIKMVSRPLYTTHLDRTTDNTTRTRGRGTKGALGRTGRQV